MGAFHPSWGDIHLGPDNALEALALLGSGAFLPVHWGHLQPGPAPPWDEPAEPLMRLSPPCGVHWLMPQLVQAVAPARVHSVTPWWRQVDVRGAGPVEPMSWPKALPFPLD